MCSGVQMRSEKREMLLYVSFVFMKVRLDCLQGNLYLSTDFHGLSLIKMLYHGFILICVNPFNP